MRGFGTGRGRGGRGGGFSGPGHSSGPFPGRQGPLHGPPGQHNGAPQEQSISGNQAQTVSPDWQQLGFPNRFEVWHGPHHGTNYMYIGEKYGQPAYSGQTPVLTGRLSFTAGSANAPGAALGEVNDSGISRSSATIKLPTGAAFDLKKNKFYELGKTTYTYTVPIEDRGEQTFVWHMNPDGRDGPLAGFWKVYRGDDESQPLAIFTDHKGPQVRELGVFEFVGEGATGELGQLWATVTVLAFLKGKQKQLLKRIRKAVTLGT